MAESVEIPFRDLDELEGATLAGRFLLHEMIGRGGYGAVFAAEQTSMGRRCAVKVLVPHVLERRRNVRRFEREARATSQLAHPNTVVIYDFGVDEERKLLYLAMEYIEGDSLRMRIHREGRLDVESTVWIAHQAAGSLEDAHDHGLVHRDVKPHNIMLTRRGGEADFVKVIDFGIAKFLDDEAIRETFRRVTQTGAIIGTPAYMSPEQVRSQELDGRSDQYSLAVCVYQMLSGRTLFRGESAVDIASKQLTHRPRPLSELNPDVGPEFDAVLLRALEKDRARRFDTITEFTLALAEAAGVPLRGTVDSAERRRAAAAEEGTATITVTESRIATIEQGEATATEQLQLADEPSEPTRPAQLAVVTPEDDAETFDAAPRLDAVRALPLQNAEAPGEPSKTPVYVGVIALVALMLVVVGVMADRDEPVGAPDEPEVVSTPPSVAAVSAPVEPGPPSPAREAVVAAPDAGEIAKAAEPEPSAIAKPSHEPMEATIAKPGEPTTPKSAAPGTVTVTVVPWGTVVVDGQARGEDRRQSFDLKPGSHVVELHQGGQRVARKTVDVQPGKNTMVELIATP